MATFNQKKNFRSEGNARRNQNPREQSRRKEPVPYARLITLFNGRSLQEISTRTTNSYQHQ